MRVMRASVYLPDSITNPITFVVRQDAVTMPLEEVAEDEFGFVYSEIYEVPDEESFVKTSLEGAQRVNVEDEANMAVMYYWLHAQFPILKKNGVVLSDIPAPLNVEQIQYVHRKLKKLSDYDGFTFTTFAQDGTPVTTSKEGQTP